METFRLFVLPLDPNRIAEVREHFDDLADRRDVFERGLAMENMAAEAAWLDESEPALYYLHVEDEDYPADIDRSDVDDEAVLELSADHREFFQRVAAEGHDHPDDLREVESLFSATADDDPD